MARNAEYSDEQIIEAGRKMLAAGKRITGFGLRNAVGGGNPNRLMQTWETHQLADSGDRQEVMSELPMELAEHLETIIGSFTTGFGEQFTRIATDMHHRSVKASERRVREMTEAAQEKEEKAKAEIEDASLAVEKAESDLEKSQNVAADLERRLEKSQESERQKDFEIKQLKKDLEALEKSSSKAADDAAKEATKLNGMIEKLESEKDAAIGRVSRLEGELEAASKRHTEDKAENGSLHKELAVKDQEIGKLSGKLEAAATSHSELKALYDDVQKTRKNLEEGLKTAEGSLAKEQALHQDAIAKSKSEIESRDAVIVELKAKLEANSKPGATK